MNILRQTRMSILMLVAVLIPVTVAAQDAQERIESTLEQAEQAGIPLDLLQSKVDEGNAKGIPMDRIAEAVQARMDGLARAQQALSGVPDVGPADLEVGADAIESGVSGEMLAELVRTAPRESRATAIVALTYLVDAEIAPQEALDAVEGALNRGPEALMNLPAQARGPGAVETPVGPAGSPEDLPGNAPADVGAPDGIPAPGGAPAGSRPDGAGPPTGGAPTGGPPAGLPG